MKLKSSLHTLHWNFWITRSKHSSHTNPIGLNTIYHETLEGYIMHTMFLHVFNQGEPEEALIVNNFGLYFTNSNRHDPTKN